MLTFSDAGLQRRLDYLKNFGFENETEVVMPGTNAKMSEFQALMGILLLKRVDEMIEKRRILASRYSARLSQIPGICLPAPPRQGVRHNYAYMPVQVEKDSFGMTRDELYQNLRKYNVIARRYFYPIIPDFPCYRGMFGNSNLSTSRGLASRVITLPLYSDLKLEEVDRICDMIQYFHEQAQPAGVSISIEQNMSYALQAAGR